MEFKGTIRPVLVHHSFTIWTSPTRFGPQKGYIHFLSDKLLGPAKRA